ncbi:MFS transporter [Arthrobacter sp. zg-Y820]|uniref:MFS transporter n=1 Tax=unclassified Arthrobacter TaxID=235627 RepID=UPI001E3F36E9|nr:MULTISPECIES: MFS transporter [unclassified Arthrobacter]MCC9196131.1 MFS transporter [Arthrobacter sp. zg-Y820]MDK1278990.1 MFS transporter [Arthrobacter sp. zg.Y820]WIB08597.1 MFS transporter [Arthrobacter sp. zg-Y820]
MNNLPSAPTAPRSSTPGTPPPNEQAPREPVTAEASPAEAERTPAEATAGRYARIFALAGRGFVPVAFLARLPLAMLTVGALTLVTSVTGSYATGGLAAGAVGIGSALGAPVLGYVADRVGQRPVLLTTAVVNPLAIALTLYMAFQLPDAATPFAALAAAFLMGATCPQVGPLARVRWMAMTERRRGADTAGARDLDTAMSFESTADELSFVLGPALVGLLAAAVAPWLPLAIAAVLTLTMVSAFAVHPTVRSVVPARAARAAKAARDADAEKAGNPVEADAVHPRADWLLIALPVLGMVAMGTFFGGTQTSLTAFGGLFDIASAAGLLYAVMGISSAAAALSVAFWPERFTAAARWMVSAAAMAAFSVLLLFPADIPTMLVALFVLGIPVGPTMVSIFGIGAVVAPRHLMGTVMTMLASGVVTGTAIGASLAGRLADSDGHQAAFLVPVGAAVVLLILSLCVRWAIASRRGAANHAAG